MAEFTAHAPGTPCWVDIASPDVDASKAFYSSLFGWDAEDLFDDDGNRIYVNFSLDGKTAAGLGGMPPGADGMPPVWNTYIATDDCAATAAAVTAAGGTVMMPPMQVMKAGEMAVFLDPTGAAFSVWKAANHIGVQVGNIPNTYSWNELLSRDVEAAKAFYSEVFGWKYSDGAMPDGSYNLIDNGADGLGGLMAMPEEMPPMVPNHWAVYFTVADLSASIELVKTNGGEIMMEPTEVPNIGTFAVVHDNVGASFYILQPG